MKSIVTFECSDGKKFKDEEAAIAYERNLKVVDGVKKMLEAKGQTKVGKTKSGKEIVRYIGLKRTLAIIGDWEEMKEAA